MYVCVCVCIYIYIYIYIYQTQYSLKTHTHIHSDVRSKNGLQEKIFLTTNKTLSGFFATSEETNNKGPASPNTGKTCLIMDEVDGMSAGDRGGMSELITIIKTTKTPIICIANDYYDKKIASLKNHCLDIKFAKPPKIIVVKRLAEIAAAEGFVVPNPTAIERLYESAGMYVCVCVCLCVCVRLCVSVCL
jgi:replication factor C subunit 1